MQSYGTPESDPDEYLSRDLLAIRETAEEHPPALSSESTWMTEVIRRGLSSEFHYYATVETIFYTLTVALTDTQAKSWFEPIINLVEQRPIADGKIFEVGFREVLLGFRTFVGVYGAIDSAHPIVVDDLLQSYIKLIKLLVYRPGFHIPPSLFDQALNVAKRLDDHIETGKLYQAIALYATHNSEFETAESYALLAYTDAEFIEDAERIIDAACTLAIVYRFQERLSKADFYIRRAMSKVSTEQPNIRFATVFYENGVYCYRKDKFDLSLSYYERALVIFEEYEAVYQIAMTQQALAQTHIYLKNYAKAEALIYAARRVWEQFSNNYDWITSFYVEADLELKRGNRLLGIQIMRGAIDKAYTLLTDIYARDLLIQDIKNHIEKNS